ncbi:MAG: DUF1579 domain-containing protein [Planctomycetota bacterium]
MKISCKNSLVILGIIAATAFITVQFSGPSATAAQDDDMGQMMALASPGAHHEYLKQWEGNWKLTTKWRMSADMPWDETPMKASSKLAMGGRYLIENVSGPEVFPGSGPFEGKSIMGYDNFKKRYFSLWIDSMSTAPMTEYGQIDESGKVLTTEGENLDAMSGKLVQTKSVATIVDEDTRKIQMFGPNEKGEMFQSMEIVYTRQ